MFARKKITLYDKFGHEIQHGDRVTATIKDYGKVSTCDCIVRGFSHYRPQVLVHVIRTGWNVWCNVANVVVQPKVGDS